MGYLFLCSFFILVTPLPCLSVVPVDRGSVLIQAVFTMGRSGAMMSSSKKAWHWFFVYSSHCATFRWHCIKVSSCYCAMHRLRSSHDTSSTRFLAVNSKPQYRICASFRCTMSATFRFQTYFYINRPSSFPRFNMSNFAVCTLISKLFPSVQMGHKMLKASPATHLSSRASGSCYRVHSATVKLQ